MARSGGHRMIEQRGDSIVITGRSMLGALYRSVLLGVAHRRANGVPSGDLQQLARCCTGPICRRSDTKSPPPQTISHAQTVRTAH